MDTREDREHARRGTEGAEIVYLFDPAALPAEGEPLPCTPAELFGLLDEAVARAGLGDVAVTGVVVGVRRKERWCAFELADEARGSDSPAAVVRVVLFAKVLRSVDAELNRQARTLREGMRVTVSGALRADPPFGGFRLVATGVEALEDVAEVVARRDALLAEVEATGLARTQAALVVPGRPRRIGVVAASGSAAAADVAALLETSGLDWQLLPRSVPMAGPKAAVAVAAALAQLARARPDVILVTRGGGGRAELACWDSECVVRAVASCPVPVWTAIGHAPDVTLADRVAHRSWPTPSAAASALVQQVRDDERRRREEAACRTHAEGLAAARAATRRARLAAAAALLALVAMLLLVVATRA